MELTLEFLCYRKARRKDRECSATQEQEHKLYLEEAVLERKIPETDLRQLVELPPGLGYEEWLASHSKYKHPIFPLPEPPASGWAPQLVL